MLALLYVMLIHSCVNFKFQISALQNTRVKRQGNDTDTLTYPFEGQRS